MQCVTLCTIMLLHPCAHKQQEIYFLLKPYFGNHACAIMTTLSPNKFIKENIAKARRAFLPMEQLMHFADHVIPYLSLFNSKVLPIFCHMVVYDQTFDDNSRQILSRDREENSRTVQVPHKCRTSHCSSVTQFSCDHLAI